jgi:hypothetical protein
MATRVARALIWNLPLSAALAPPAAAMAKIDVATATNVPCLLMNSCPSGSGMRLQDKS